MNTLYLAVLSTILLTGCILDSTSSLPRASLSIAPDSQTKSTSSSFQSALSKEIRVSFPLADTIISSPLIVTGEAKGNWFFEANLRLELQDNSGTVISTGNAQATGDWMTEDFVPFRGVLKFTPPDLETGILVIRKANPSDLEENDLSIEIPISFL